MYLSELDTLAVVAARGGQGRADEIGV